MTHAAERLLYIGGGREAEETLRKAHALGLDVVYVQRKHQFKEALLPCVNQVILVDYDNLDILLPLARTLHAVFPFARALSLSEDALLPAAHVRAALGLPGNSVRTVELLKDKACMRQHLNAIGLGPVASRVGTTPEDVARFVDEHGLPIIVKPVDASGSLGIFRIDSADQIDAVCANYAALDQACFLMEEFLDGPEFSVESATFDGRHVIVAITDKLKLDNFVEIGHSIPARLDSATRCIIEAFTCQFLDAVQLEEGPAHTEIKLTRHGPRVIESHDRPGGDRINELVRVAYDVDLKAVALGGPNGLVPQLRAAPSPRAGAAIRFFAPAPGVVREIRGLPEAERADGVVELHLGVRPGDRVRPIAESYDRVGWVICQARSVELAIERCEAILRQVEIVTTPA